MLRPRGVPARRAPEEIPVASRPGPQGPHGPEDRKRRGSDRPEPQTHLNLDVAIVRPPPERVRWRP